jgi:hypothetical protein
MIVNRLSLSQGAIPYLALAEHSNSFSAGVRQWRDAGLSKKQAKGRQIAQSEVFLSAIAFRMSKPNLH